MELEQEQSMRTILVVTAAATPQLFSNVELVSVTVTRFCTSHSHHRLSTVEDSKSTPEYISKTAHLLSLEAPVALFPQHID